VKDHKWIKDGIPGPGIHKMTMEEYIAHPAVSRGVMLKALINPALALASMNFPGETTKEMSLGTATHTCLYEPEEMLLRYAIWKDRVKDEKTGKDKNQKRAGEKWETHKKAAESAGKDPNLTESEQAHAMSMSKAVQEHPTTGALLRRRPCRFELVIIFKDPVTGILIKVRIDQLIEDDFPTVGDLKTCQSVSDRLFSAEIITYGYDIQSWLYPAGFRAVGDHETVNFVISAVEKKKTIPSADGKSLTHAVRVFEMDCWQAGGHARARYALDILAQCRKNNEWPSYPLRVERLDPPDWYLKQWGGRR